jgi:hypothetical protein
MFPKIFNRIQYNQTKIVKNTKPLTPRTVQAISNYVQTLHVRNMFFRKIAKSQSHKITKSQSHKITKSQSHKITKSQNHKI